MLAFEMGTVSQFPGRIEERSTPKALRGQVGELVAMRHVDLETVIETVRALRTLDDQSFLDGYNRVDRPGR